MPKPKKPKPTFVEFPATILIDTSEQLPYHFRELNADADHDHLPYVIRTEKANLKATGGGDYSIKGLEKTFFSLERKNPQDFLGSLTRGRKNFEAEIERLHSKFMRSAVVVEAEWSELIRICDEETQIAPKSVIRTVMSWNLRYPMVNWWFVPGRRSAEVLTFGLLRFAYEMAKGLDYIN